MYELVQAIRNGDRARLTDLYKQNYGLIYKLARRYVDLDNAVTIDDLTQAGFLGLYVAVDAWEPARGAWSTVAYLHVWKAMREAVGLSGRKRTLARAVSLDEPLLGDEGGATTRLDMLADESLAAADASLLADEQSAALMEAVARLAPDECEAIRLHELEGLSYARVGVCMGVGVQRARALQARAIRNLHKDAELERALDMETRFHGHKGVRAFLSDWTSATEGAALWRIEHRARRDSRIGGSKMSDQ